MKHLFYETGKYLYDVSKILLAIAVVTPLVKSGGVSYLAVAGTAVSFLVGTYLIHKKESK